MNISKEDRILIENAIKRKIKAANRAVKSKKYNRVAELYFDISNLFLELGDSEKSKLFNKSAKKYEAKGKLEEILMKYIEKAKNEFSKGNYEVVGKIYLQIAQIIEKINPSQATIYREFGNKILSGQLEHLAIYNEISKPIQYNQSEKSTSTDDNDINQVFIELVVVCPHCGADLEPDSDVCPKCGSKVE
ncbi:MAG: zinc ribbon domain-containing protein [Candidatus Helarchaeota archaeon]